MRAALVGRERELKLLLDTIERAKAERAVHVFTLLGEPGVGKSRLVGEVLARLRTSPRCCAAAAFRTAPASRTGR